MADVFRIEPDHAGLQRIGHPQRAAHVAGPDIAGQAILHAIGDLDRVVLVLEGDHGQERAEHFLLRHPHFRMRAGDQRRLHVMSAAGAVMRLAADRNGGAVLLRDVEIAADFGEMPLMDQRPDFGGGIERMPDLQGLHPRGQLLDEFSGDTLLDQEPARRGAALAIERVDHEDNRIERPVEIGVVEHDHGVLAAEFEMDALQGGGALRHDGRAGRALADEADRLDRGMLGQRLAGFLAHAVDGVEHAIGQAGLFRKL